MKLKKLILFTLFIFTLLIVSCGDSNEKPKNVTISTNISEVNLYIGENKTIDVECNPSDAESELVWAIENEMIATVNNGVVTAHNIGQTKLYIYCGDDKNIDCEVKINVIRHIYKISYQLDGGHFDFEPITSFKEGLGLDELPIPVKENHIFDGWYYNDNYVTNISSSINNDITLVAKWIEVILPIYHNIEYKLDGGIFETEVEKSYQEGVGLTTLPIPTKEGYIFDGWYYNDILITNIDDKFNTDVTLVAKWKKEEQKSIYKISYELDGGIFDGDVVYSYEEGTGLSELPIPTKDNHKFDGWFLDDELITSISDTMSGDITLTAKWSYQENEFQNAADIIIKLINTLPYNTSYNDKQQIDYIINLYNELADEAKLLVSNKEVLFEKVQVIKNIEENVNEITYVLGKNVYLNREELFVNFFSDFYNYIKNYHGTEYLENKGIMNIDDFVELAGDYDAGNGTMREIGNIAGNYMLIKDLNGILENQPDNGFFGYCYKNNLYNDLLPFFIRFFAYWRIDERYANTSNYGADMFAESWAPTVDIAKFFYYDSETTYVKTDRMLDCFNYCSNVVYGNLPTKLVNGMELPSDISLRGYKFAGWYDNPNFEGSPITTINSTTEKIILYAKWIDDEDQQQKDNAELVDIYIYNLTTKPANACKQTVLYVRNMYDALSDYGKAMVMNYDTLIEYETKFAEELLNPVTVTINAQFDNTIDIEFIREQFLLDFNGVTNSNVKKIEVFISKHYSYMDEMGEFFSNSLMMAKWGYLLDLLYNDDSFAGIKIQVDRIKKNESGDLEYVTKALANLLLSQDATSDGEILVDYSDKSIVENLVNNFGTFKLTFKTAISIPKIVIYGYDFGGYFDLSNNQITKVSEDMPIELIAIYKKN